MKRYYLGLDNGTTGTTALLLDERWKQVGRGYCEVSRRYPRDGWAEQDAEEIWQSILAAASAACETAGIEPTQIACVGLANVGETVVLWDRGTGKPVYPAVGWQDRRTAQLCETLQASHGAFVKARAGLDVDSYFSATKLRWIIDNVDGVKEGIAAGRILGGTLDGWLLWKLSGGSVFSTDPSTASRTMLMNLRTGEWDDGLLQLFGVPRTILPEICGNAELRGYTDPDAFLGARIPVSGAAVDQQAALFGQCCFTPGMTKCTYGTGCFMLMNTGDRPVTSEHGLVTTVAWRLDGKLQYALDGGVYVAGAATQWLRDNLGIIRSASETEQLALAAGSNGGVYFVPAFSGLGAPYRDPYARGAIFGLTGGTTREQIVRATLESTAYQVRDVLDAMNADVPVTRLRADGGAAVNGFLMQFQADLLGIPVDVPEITETTALGAAYLAAIGIGESSRSELPATWKLARSYEPKMGEDERRTLLHGWHKAVERVKLPDNE